MLKYDFSFAFKETLESGLSFDEMIDISKTLSTNFERVFQPLPGFLRILESDEILEEVKAYRSWLEHFDNFVVIGIGGSALGNQALHSALKPVSWNSYVKEKRAQTFAVSTTRPRLTRPGRPLMFSRAN